MQKISISGIHTNAFECEGLLDLIFDKTTNIRVVVYANIITKDGVRHPFTLLITDEANVKDTIQELIESYGEEFADIETSSPQRIIIN